MTPAAFKILMLSSFLFAATAGAAWYLWQLEEKQGEEITAAMVATATSENSPEASAELVAAVDELESLVLPGAEETVDFLAFVEEVARQTGVIIEVSNLDVAKTKVKGFDDLSASFVVTGPKEAVEGVLVVFENLPYHSRITALNLERGREETRADLSLIITVRE